MTKTPKVLDKITDLVLAYRPKPKTKPARRRKRAAAKRANQEVRHHDEMRG